MENLQDQQTKIFDKYGVFFAFSNKQFNEAKQDGVKYADLGGGMLAPSDNADNVIKELTNLHNKHIKEDLAENGKKAIIHRELANHEAQITGEIDDTFDALESYGITRAEIQAEYTEYYNFCVLHNYF